MFDLRVFVDLSRRVDRLDIREITRHMASFGMLTEIAFSSQSIVTKIKSCLARLGMEFNDGSSPSIDLCRGIICASLTYREVDLIDSANDSGSVAWASSLEK
jgi:hypothetical protein